MSSYVEMTVTNDPYKGGITISSTPLVSSVDELDKILIKRKVEDSSYIDIYTADISSVDDLTFECLDMNSMSGIEYKYALDVYKSGKVIETSILGTVECYFDGMFIGDENSQYFAATSWEVEYKRNTQVEYVTTLQGKYPYRISNAETNYCTGSAEGLFLDFTSDYKQFVPDNYHKKSIKILDFLTDGNTKTLKTSDGYIWRISIDSEPEEKYNDRYVGYNIISFEWTEIEEVPDLGMVKL